MTRVADGDENSPDARRWTTAVSLSDIGDLMARWLEGEITYQPANGGDGPDEETGDLVPLLAAFNRVGYVTTFSQPGEDEDGWYQRAAVEGFCDEETATRIYDAVLETDLIPLVWPPGAVSECHQIPISREGSHQNTWAGRPLDTANIDHWYGPALSAEGLAALHRAYQVLVIDPRWGRNDYLWPVLATALRVPAEP